LSLFRAGFEEEAAERITGAPPETLADLVDKSLLRRDGSGLYEMHRLLQQYAHESLRTDPAEQQRVEDRFCDYYSRFLHERQAWLRGSRQSEALKAITAGIDNARLMWHLAVARGDLGALSRSLTSLGTFYAIRCWNQEGARVFGEAAGCLVAASLSGRQVGHEARPQEIITGQLLAWQGHFVHQLGRHAEARALLEKSLDLLRLHAVPDEMAFSLYTLAQILLHGQNDYESAARLFEESLAVYGAEGDRYGRAQSLDALGDVATRLGKHDEARSHYEQGLALRRQIGDLWGISVSLGSLGGLAGRQGDYEEARRRFEESLAIGRDLENPRGLAACLHNLSTVAYLRGDYREAKRLRQETLDICRQIGYRWGVAGALKSLGDVARRLGEHGQAKQYLAESLALVQEAGDRRSQAYTLNSLGTVVQAMGDSQGSRRYFREALEVAMEIREPALALDILASLAKLTAERGEIDRALELLSFVVHHPACEEQTRVRSEPLRLELARQVGADVASAAEARGRALDLDDVAAWAPDRRGF
jgi:tetratricopeptide (TPR) repeat protein